MFAAAHLTQDSLRELLGEERSPAADRLLLHLLAVCPECREAGGDLLELAERGAIRPPFGPVDVELARSRAQAPALWAELLALPSIERRRVVRDRRFLSWGLAERLAEESVAAQDAREAIDLARLAIAIARRIPPDDPFEEGWRVQLEALAVVHLAAARLRFGDREGAASALRRMERLWQRADSIGDVLGYRPRMVELAGRVLAGLGEETRALAAFEAARKAYSSQDRTLDAARVAIETAIHHARAGRDADARHLARALPAALDENDPAAPALALFRAAAEEGTLTPGLAEEIHRQLERERAAIGSAFPAPESSG